MLIWRDPLFVLQHGLDNVDGVGSVDDEGNGPAGQSLHEDLHAAPMALHRLHGLRRCDALAVAVVDVVVDALAVVILDVDMDALVDGIVHVVVDALAVVVVDVTVFGVALSLDKSVRA